MSGPFERNCLGLYKFVFHSLNPPWFLQPEVMGTSLPGTGSWAGGPGVELRSLTLEISLLIFTHHILVWDQPVLLLHLTYQLRCGFFFNFVVVGLPFSSVSHGSE